MFKYQGYFWSITPIGSAYILKYEFQNKEFFDVFSSLEAIAAYIDDNFDIQGEQYVGR